MIVSLSFDDGRSDSYEAYQILKSYKLKATFHITSGFIDGTYSTNNFGINRKPLTIDQIKEMNINGMEISSHGDKHVMESDDFKKSYKKICEWTVQNEGIGFSVPNSSYSNESLENFIKQNKKCISFVRVGRDERCYSLFSKVCYLLESITHFQCFYNSFNKFNLMTTVNPYKIVSLIVTKRTKPRNLISFIKKYNHSNTRLVLMFHSIVESPKNKWEYSTKNFNRICEFLSKNIDVKTTGSLVKQYGRN